MTLYILYIKESKVYMKKKKDITITIDPKIFKLIDENFDNRSRIIEWFIIDGLSKNEEFKKLLEKIIF